MRAPAQPHLDSDQSGDRDTPAESPRELALARIAALAARLCSAPVSLISIVDSESHFLGACHGLPGPDRPDGLRLCAEILLADSPVVAGDTRTDPRLAHHALVSIRGVRACLAYPVRVNSESPALGTLCLLDVGSRAWTAGDLMTVEDLAASVAALLTLAEPPSRRAGAPGDASYLDAAFARAPVGLAHLRPDGSVLRANAALARLLDRTGADLADSLLWDQLQPEDRLQVVDRARRAGLRHHDSFTQRVRLLRQGGELLSCDLTVTTERAGDSANGFLLATLVDVTAVATAEQKLTRSQGVFEDAIRLRTRELSTANEMLRSQNRAIRDSETAWRATAAGFRTMADSLPALISHWDDTLTLRFANAAHADFSREPVSSLIGRAMVDIFGEKLHDSIIARVEAVLAGIPQQFERRIKTTAGDKRVINLHWIPQWENGLVVGFFSIGVNITDLRQRSDALARREALLRATSDVAGVAGWEYDLRTGSFSCSDVVARIIDMPPATGTDTVDLRDYFPPYVRAEIDAAFSDAIQLHTRFALELPLISSRRRPKWVRMVGEPQIVEGRCESIVGALQDVTAERTSAQSLRAATAAAKRANSVKDLFLANMSHEIRTPLNGVIGMTGLLLDTELSGEQREYVEIARSSGETLLGLVNDILDLAKIESDQLELERIDFAMRTIVDEAIDAVALAAAQKGIELVTDLQPGSDGTFRGDPTRLRQVLINLLGNAVKFTETGAVTLEIVPAGLGEGRIGLDIAIKDTGIGIPPDRLEKLFAPFTQADAATTRRYGGTGLGLSICKRIVEAMRGLIAVDSEVGVGTTFRVRVELEEASPGQQPAVARRTERALVYAPRERAATSLAGDLDHFGIGAVCCTTVEDFVLQWARAIEEGRVFEFCFIDSENADSANDARISALLEGSTTHIFRLCSLNQLVAETGGARRVRYLQKPLRRHALQRSLHTLLDACSPPAAHSVAGATLVGRRVLLAEDNPVNVKLAMRLLERLGVQVTWAANGQEALKHLAAERFDVVLMDCQMPEMDGYDATRALRRGECGVLDPDVPVIALTAHALASDRERCYAAGMDDYVQKPIDPRRLAAAMGQLSLPNGAQLEPPCDDQAQAEIPASPAPLPATTIDLAHLDEITGDDREFRRELLVAYLGSAGTLVSALDAALTLSDDTAIRRAAHQLRGASLSIGAGPVAALADKLEAGDYDGRSAAALAALWTSTRMTVENLLQAAR
jgi:signal transduction histidine kinase/CheY-like chemotaxis protein